MRVILIGAGLSSALTAQQLRKQYGPSAKLVVYEKDKHIGGRMITTYATDEKHSAPLDLGFQYLAVKKTNPVTSKFFQEWVDNHVIEELERKNTVGLRYKPDVIDYAAPRGIQYVAEYLFEQAGAEIHLSKKITKIDLNASKDKYIIYSDDEKLDESEVVIVTIPVPEILKYLKGSIAQLIDENKEIKENLAEVKYYSRFAVGLFYPPSVQSLNVPWRIYSVGDKENDVVRMIVNDNWKRNRDEPPYSLVTHTDTEYAAKHLEEDEKVVGEQVKEELFKFMPDLPKDADACKYRKWRYCQVEKPYTGKPGYVVLHDRPLLVLTGDSFIVHSLTEPHIEAAIKTVERVAAVFP